MRSVGLFYFIRGLEIFVHLTFSCLGYVGFQQVLAVYLKLNYLIEFHVFWQCQEITTKIVNNVCPTSNFNKMTTYICVLAIYTIIDESPRLFIPKHIITFDSRSAGAVGTRLLHHERHKKRPDLWFLILSRHHISSMHSLRRRYIHWYKGHKFNTICHSLPTDRQTVCGVWTSCIGLKIHIKIIVYNNLAEESDQWTCFTPQCHEKKCARYSHPRHYES